MYDFHDAGRELNWFENGGYSKNADRLCMQYLQQYWKKLSLCKKLLDCTHWHLLLQSLTSIIHSQFLVHFYCLILKPSFRFIRIKAGYLDDFHFPS